MVAASQVSRARQVFARSALQAGFFSTGKDRLVKPSQGAAPTIEKPDPAREEKKREEKNDGEGTSPLSDPMLMGLLRRMLPPEGQPFSAQDRELFFRALAVNLDVIYGRPTEAGNSEYVIREEADGEVA